MNYNIPMKQLTFVFGVGVVGVVISFVMAVVTESTKAPTTTTEPSEIAIPATTR